ncbi:MAG: hypothetical protein EA437_05945 [Candidatus Nitrosomarinus sp.]|nr:MAG: hypothetical protein EA437_05945 [Candidatus Nitrosomarinus sp.]
MSSDDLFTLFSDEFEKLKKLLDQISPDNELTVNQIVEIYYQITNVSSLTEVIKQQLDDSDSTSFEKISNAQNFISENFNSTIHPKIMKNIDDSISEITKNLQSLNSDEKSKETIENEAKLYEKLREFMSTKEFVMQYNAGLSND